MRKSKKTGKKVTNAQYVRELGEGFLPTKEDLEELADIAVHGMASEGVLDDLDNYFLSVQEKHHGFGDDDGEADL